MPNKLIYKDQEQIAKSISALNEIVTFIQQVYNQFKIIGITLTEAEIIDLLKSYRTASHQAPFVVEEYVKDKLIENAPPMQHGGIITISKTKLRELIELPDLSVLKSIFKVQQQSSNILTSGTIVSATIPVNAAPEILPEYVGMWAKFSQLYQSSYINDKILSELIFIENDTVKKEKKAAQFIEDMFTYKTKTAKGDEIVDRLQQLCNILNEWLPFAGKNGLPGNIQNGGNYGDGKFIPGINILSNATCVPSINFVQTYEKF